MLDSREKAFVRKVLHHYLSIHLPLTIEKYSELKLMESVFSKLNLSQKVIYKFRKANNILELPNEDMHKLNQ